MPFRETVTVYCEKHKEHTDTFYGQNAEFMNVYGGGTMLKMPMIRKTVGRRVWN
jgi:hypothetical protein